MRKHTRRTKAEMVEIHKNIDRLLAEGLLSNTQIANEVGCTTRTVWEKRQALHIVPSEKIKYTGGGEW